MDLEDLSWAAVVAGADAEPVLERMRPIKGWFSDAEARLLLNVACCALMELRDGHEVVEVGAYEGRSTVVLASAVQALHSSGRLVSVDHVPFHDYSRNFPDVVTCVEEIHQQGCLAVRGVEGDLIVLQRRIAGTPT